MNELRLLDMFKYSKEMIGILEFSIAEDFVFSSVGTGNCNTSKDESLDGWKEGISDVW